MLGVSGHPSMKRLLRLGIRHGTQHLRTSVILPVLVTAFVLLQGSVLFRGFSSDILIALDNSEVITLTFSETATDAQIEKIFLALKDVAGVTNLEYRTKEQQQSLFFAQKPHLSQALHDDGFRRDSLVITLGSLQSYRPFLSTLRDTASPLLFDESSLLSLQSFEQRVSFLLRLSSVQSLLSRALLFFSVVLCAFLFFVAHKEWRLLCAQDLSECAKLGAKKEQLQCLCFGTLITESFLSYLVSLALVGSTLLCLWWLFSRIDDITLFQSIALPHALLLFGKSSIFLFLLTLILSCVSTILLTDQFSFRAVYGKKVR